MPMFRGFLAIGSRDLIPAMRAANGDHRVQDASPCFRLHHSFVREHAAIPTDVMKRASEVALPVAQPCSSGAHDVQLAVWIVGETMPAGLIMRARAPNRRIVLSHVEIDHPR